MVLQKSIRTHVRRKIKVNIHTDAMQAQRQTYNLEYPTGRKSHTKRGWESGTDLPIGQIKEKNEEYQSCC